MIREKTEFDRLYAEALRRINSQREELVLARAELGAIAETLALLHARDLPADVLQLIARLRDRARRAAGADLP